MATGSKVYVDLLQVYMAASPLPQVTTVSCPPPVIPLRPLFQVESRLISKYKQRLEDVPSTPAEFTIRLQLPTGQQVEETVNAASRGFTLLQKLERRLPDRTKAPILTFQSRILDSNTLVHKSISELGLTPGCLISIAYR